jgi:Domain of unknown function (DUF4129)
MWARQRYASMLVWARHTQQRVQGSPRGWMLITGAIALALLLLANLGRIARTIHERWIGAHPERSPEQAASLWYQRMTRLLTRTGLEKSEAETPQEFIRRIPDAKLRMPVTQFTSVYESARFGNSSQDACRLPELFEEVQAATRSE